MHITAWYYGLSIVRNINIGLLAERRRTRWININGMGILDRYRGLGGNALLYHELEQNLQQGRFEYPDLVHMTGTVDHMLADVTTLGAKPYKVHRVFRRDIG